MPCVLVIKDRDLKRILDRKEDANVSFESFQDYLNAIPPGAEYLISESDGHFIGTFRQLAYDSGNIRMLYTSEYGRGSVPISEVLGPVSTELLIANQDRLNPLAKARLIPPVSPDFNPENADEAADGAGDSVISDTAEYDEEASRIKVEQFESTTGQDVENDFTGTLNSRPSTLSKMALKSVVADNPSKFRYFIVKDSPAYFNDPGIEPGGEVMLVVHRAAYDRLESELGRVPTQEEMQETAVRIKGTQISAEGDIFTLPLEGTSPSRAEEGVDDQFFQRKHEERLQIYAEKNGVTEDEADYHFRQGQENMRNMRDQAATSPVEVSVRPSLGYYPNNPMSIDAFENKYNLEDTYFTINLNKSKVVGRVYLTATMEGNPVEMLTVPVNLTTKYGADTLAGIAGRFLTGSASQEEINFFASIFGVNRRKAGPYMRIDGETAILMSEGNRINSVEQFNNSLAKNSWPSITNKIRGKESMNQHTALRGSTFVVMSPDEFIREHVETDGSFWTHRGKPVPYAANRYFYIDPAPSGLPVSLNLESTDEGVSNAVNTLFSNAQEFDRIFGSNDPKDVERKLSAPYVFSPVFALSQSYKRLRSGLKMAVRPLAGQFSLDIPVGDEYFSNRLDVGLKLSDLVKDYTKADLITARDRARVNLSVNQMTLGTPTGNILMSQVTADTSDEEIEGMFTQAIRVGIAQQVEAQLTERAARRIKTLNSQGVYDIEALGIDTDSSLEDFIYTMEANALVANIENQLLFGDTKSITGKVPDVTGITNMGVEPSFVSNFAEEELAPTQVIRSVKMDDPVITLDTYRLYKKLSGTWTTEDEANYQKELSGETGTFEDNITLAYSGPVNVKMSDGVVTAAMDSRNTDPIRYRVLVPSSEEDAGIHRELLLAEAGLSSTSGDTFYIGNFAVPGEQVLSAEEEILSSLTDQKAKRVAQTELSDYAQAVLGKNLANKLLGNNKNLTFDDINKYAGFLGDDRFDSTRFRTQKDFALSPNTAQAIADGQKKITLRKKSEEAKGVMNTGGLVQIDGKVFEIADLGEMGLKKALEITGLTQNEFAQQFLGDDSKTIADIFDPGVKAFFDGVGSRRVFSIQPVVKPFKTNGVKKGTKVKKRTNEKTSTLACRTLR